MNVTGNFTFWDIQRDLTMKNTVEVVAPPMTGDNAAIANGLALQAYSDYQSGADGYTIDFAIRQTTRTNDQRGNRTQAVGGGCSYFVTAGMDNAAEGGMYLRFNPWNLTIYENDYVTFVPSELETHMIIIPQNVDSYASIDKSLPNGRIGFNTDYASPYPASNVPNPTGVFSGASSAWSGLMPGSALAALDPATANQATRSWMVKFTTASTGGGYRYVDALHAKWGFSGVIRVLAGNNPNCTATPTVAPTLSAASSSALPASLFVMAVLAVITRLF